MVISKYTSAILRISVTYEPLVKPRNIANADEFSSHMVVTSQQISIGVPRAPYIMRYSQRDSSVKVN